MRLRRKCYTIFSDQPFGDRRKNYVNGKRSSSRAGASAMSGKADKAKRACEYGRYNALFVVQPVRLKEVKCFDNSHKRVVRRIGYNTGRVLLMRDIR